MLSPEIFDEGWSWEQPHLLSSQIETQLDSVNLDYDVYMSLENSECCVNLEIRMRRKVARSIIEIISPSAILVITSWVRYPTSIIPKNWLFIQAT